MGNLWQVLFIGNHLNLLMNTLNLQQYPNTIFPHIDNVMTTTSVRLSKTQKVVSRISLIQKVQLTFRLTFQASALP